MLPVLFLLFVGVPILELYVIIRVGEAIGALPTIALLVGDSLLGAWLMRSQGRQVWRRFTAALAEGRAPAREVLDGALVLLGGALQLTPGFVTDALGLALVLPPGRAVARRALVRRLAGRGALRVAVRRPPPAAGSPYDVEGTAREARDEPRRLP